MCLSELNTCWRQTEVNTYILCASVSGLVCVSVFIKHITDSKYGRKINRTHIRARIEARYNMQTLDTRIKQTKITYREDRCTGYVPATQLYTEGTKYIPITYFTCFPYMPSSPLPLYTHRHFNKITTRVIFRRFPSYLRGGGWLKQYIITWRRLWYRCLCQSREWASETSLNITAETMNRIRGGDGFLRLYQRSEVVRFWRRCYSCTNAP